MHSVYQVSEDLNIHSHTSTQVLVPPTTAFEQVTRNVQLNFGSLNYNQPHIEDPYLLCSTSCFIVSNYDIHIDDIIFVIVPYPPTSSIISIPLQQHWDSYILLLVFTLKLYLYWTHSFLILYFLQNLVFNHFLIVSLFSKYTSPNERFISYSPSLDPQSPSHLPHYH